MKEVWLYEVVMMTRTEYNEYVEQVNKGKRWCYDCVHFYDYHRWGECECKIHGWLGVGFNNMSPDTSADNCNDYNHPNGSPLWFEKYM